ncbi:frizzled-like [Xenia sp. Carnegie-2017]|uniref:frizzled-like n=1 Tax=Xenia sp. Carnegie-2017 TaxID=2897299 RepID=UPI001F033DE1|nr:frizzled-like [Xenia sp. Carnegie-2017]
MKSFASLALVFVVLSLWKGTNTGVIYKCEPLKIKTCADLGYNATVFPNFAKHRSQQEAQQTIKTLQPLLDSGCSKDLIYFICSYYVPVCTSYSIMVPPCRRMCKTVKASCSKKMIELFKRAKWPKELNCNKFPKQAKQSVCFGRNRQAKSSKSSTSFS